MSESHRMSDARRDIAFWIIAVVAQICFYLFAMPIPQRLGYQSFTSGVLVCFISALTLAALPVLLIRIANRLRGIQQQISRPPGLMQKYGLTLGDQQFGWRAVLWASPGIAIGTFIGGDDLGIQEFYPFAGSSLGESPFWFATWLPFLLLYYVAFEFFYRGFLMRDCYLAQSANEKTWLPDRSVLRIILLQAFFCVLIHIGKPNIELIAAVPASILFGWLAWRSNSIWYGVLIHLVVGIANDLGALWHSGRLDWFV